MNIHPLQLATTDRATKRSAFTLTEVLISIALVLILILGVNQVFSLTGRAVGAGQAMSEITRDARAAQAIFTRDLMGAEFDRPPFIFLDSTTTSAFRDRTDQFGDRDYSAATGVTLTTADNAIRSLDLAKTGTETRIPRVFLSSRTHRTDRFSFFTRSVNRRQTGNANSGTGSVSLTSAVGSGEMYVVYGHLLLPSDGSPTGVDSAGNVNQFLGPGIGKTIKAGSTTATTVSTGGTALTPTTNSNNFYATKWVLGRTTFTMVEPTKTTLAAGTIKDAYTGTNQRFYTHFVSTGINPIPDMHPLRGDSSPCDDGTSGTKVSGQYLPTNYYDLFGESIETFRAHVKDYALSTAGTNWTSLLDYRFIGSPKPTRPLNRDGIARTAPCFVPACTQFVVEFAGDFLNQDPNTGTVLNSVANTATSTIPKTDGVVDFVLRADPTSATGFTRAIRWYGFPRDVNNDGKITAADDVVPLRDIAGTAAAFERVVPPIAANYALETAVTLGRNYRCVWGPDTGATRPKMIRITMALDDPSVRIAGEQFFQFVVEVP